MGVSGEVDSLKSISLVCMSEGEGKGIRRANVTQEGVFVGNEGRLEG
jgi:hypothetical protein